MTVRGRFSLDTNILVYAVDQDQGGRHLRAREIVGQAARRDCVLTTKALAEFFHATTRKGLLDPSRSAALVRDWLAVFDVVSADAACLEEALSAVEVHQFSFWDAMLLATARQAGCSAILSEDMQDGRRLRGIELINPFAGGAQARLAPLLDH